MSEKGSKKAPKKRAKSPERPYTRVSLTETIKVGTAIKNLNGGNPWTPSEVAKAIGIGATTNDFYYYTSSSRDFGLTKGTSKSQSIELTEFGKELFYAPDPKTEHTKKIEAFLKIPIFKEVLEYYKGAELPDMTYLGNTLQKEFNLDPAVHEEFARLFKINTRDLGITTGSPTENTSGDIPDGIEKESTRIVGEPKKSDDSTLNAFVIMPFVEKENHRQPGFFKEVLESIITPAGVAAGFQVKTANIPGSDIIQSTIVNQLLHADIVIADLTDHNPNVLFELGLRIALEKPVAIIKSNDTGKIFDVDNMLRVYEYNANLWKSTIEVDLPGLEKHIKATWDNRESDVKFMKILTGIAITT